jgi:3,2-trans-enoyl-CoA isomerase
MLEISEIPVVEGTPEAGRIRIVKLVRRLIDAVSRGSGESAIVITGQPGLFSGGLDVPGLLALDREGISALFVDLWRVQHAVATSAVPVVFAITGHCPAGGTVLAIHGDYRVMAKGEFKLGLNETQVGLFPGPLIYGAFKRLVGGHAAQLVTRGALIDPATALRVGLVDELCDAAQVTARALEVAREYCKLPREPMLRTRALARRDLVELFGNPGQAQLQEREFAAVGADMWFVPATQTHLKSIFKKK